MGHLEQLYRTMITMLIPVLRKFLTTKLDKPAITLFWFSLSLTCAAVFGLDGLKTAFSSEYVVQDDVRQHVFWMRRFIDSAFPNDLIADYYQSVASPGFSTLYQLIAAVGIDPVIFSKILPFILTLISTSYCFRICLQLLPVPSAAFISTLLLNQNLWLKDDVISGTARAFMYPLFLAFLYYLLQRSLFPFLVAIALLGLFYPSGAIVSAGILFLRLWRWDKGIRFRHNDLFSISGIAIAVLTLLPQVESSPYGAVISANVARTMPEFSELGRTRFFVDNIFEFWFYGDRTGIFPIEWFRLPYKYFPIMLILGLFLPILQRFPSRFPLVRHISNISILPQIALVSLSLFLAAHTLLFKLYLPSRYTQYSIRILMALSAAITLTVLIDAILVWAEQKILSQIPTFLAITFTLVVMFAIFFYPFLLKIKQFPIHSTTSYIVGNYPKLYKFLSQQPEDILIASLTTEASNIPSFSQRSVLIAREYSIPYHTGYYAQIRQRTTDLIQAQYNSDLKQVKKFIQKYQVDLWLLDRHYLFTPYTEVNNNRISSTERWIRQFPAATQAWLRWQQNQTQPALVSVVDSCAVFNEQNLLILSANCIQKSLQ